MRLKYTPAFDWTDLTDRIGKYLKGEGVSSECYGRARNQLGFFIDELIWDNRDWWTNEP